jgi:hypothetical protein
MALNPSATLVIPVQLNAVAGTDTSIVIIVGAGVPDGDSDPWNSAAKGSVHIQSDATDDESPFFVKVDNDGANDDWVQVFVDKCENALTLENTLTMDADQKLYFRDTAIYIHSNADGQLTITADTKVNIGDGTNQVAIQADGEIQLEGTAKVTRAIPLPLDAGHGTATVEEFLGAPSINLDADTEEWFFSFEAPNDWDEVSDLTIVWMVANEIAEDDGDDVSFTCQVRGYADGETMSDAGQAVTGTLNLTGGDEAINVVNRVTGTIDYNEGTYPIAAGDTVVVKCAVNLGGGGECTGPLHIIAQWVEYTANKLGTAT